VVEDAPWRAHDDHSGAGGAVLERFDLWSYGHASDEDDRTDWLVAGEVRKLGRGLRGELPCRYEYERLYAPCLRVDCLDQRYGESGRLAAAGLRETDDVLPVQEGG
jgi:hypothetical protein